MAQDDDDDDVAEGEVSLDFNIVSRSEHVRSTTSGRRHTDGLVHKFLKLLLKINSLPFKLGIEIAGWSCSKLVANKTVNHSTCNLSRQYQPGKH